MGQLAQKVRAKYPGAYDDLDDATLEKQVLAKYPEYQDLVETTAPAPSAPSGGDPLIKYQGIMSSIVPKSRQLETASWVAGSEQAPLQAGLLDALKAIPDVGRELIQHPGETLRGLGAGLTEGALDTLSPATLIPYGLGKAAKVIRGLRAAAPVEDRALATVRAAMQRQAAGKPAPVVPPGPTAPAPRPVPGVPKPTAPAPNLAGPAAPPAAPPPVAPPPFVPEATKLPTPPLKSVPAPKPKLTAAEVAAAGVKTGRPSEALAEGAGSVPQEAPEALMEKFATLMAGKGAKVDAPVLKAVDDAVAGGKVEEAASTIENHVKLTVNEFASSMRRQFGSQRAGDYLFPQLGRAERKASVLRMAPGPSRTPLIVEEAKAAKAARRAMENEEGFGISGLVTTLGGGALGGAAGATVGEEEDRLQNAVIGAAAGMMAPHLISKLFSKGGVQEYTMGAMLSSPVSITKAWVGAYGGALMAASSKAAAGDTAAAGAILDGLKLNKFIPRMVQGFRNPAPLGGYAQNAPPLMQRIYGAADTAARQAMSAGGISADDAARFTLSGKPSTEIGGKALAALSGDRPIDFALRLIINAFPRVGIQSLERGAEWSPLGLSKRLIGKASTAGSGRERIARAAIGTAAAGAGAAISDSVPLWMQPLLVAAGGPVGLPLATGMAFGDARRATGGDKITAALEQIGMNAPVPRYGLVEGVKQAASGSQFIPNVVGGYARAIDPYERENEGFFGRTRAKIPGEMFGIGRETLPIRGKTKNIAGEEVEKRDALARFASGSRIPSEPMKGVPEKVNQEITRLGIDINPPTFEKTIRVGRRELDVPPDVAERARTERRKYLLPVVEKVIASPAYQRADDAAKKRRLEAAISAAERAGSAKARASVIRALGNLRGNPQAR